MLLLYLIVVFKMSSCFGCYSVNELHFFVFELIIAENPLIEYCRSLRRTLFGNETATIDGSCSKDVYSNKCN